jgi:hypothetical protein
MIMLVVQFLIILFILGAYALYISIRSFKKGVQHATIIAVEQTLCYLVFKDKLKPETITQIEPTLTKQKIELIIDENRKLWNADLRFQK